MTSLWLDTRENAPLDRDELSAGATHDTVVVGAGLTGLTTALLLARAGRQVAVLEARTVGALTTGNTTAKASLLQGSVLSGILRHGGKEALHAYVAANRAGQEWLLQQFGEGDLLQRRDAYTYACASEGAELVRREHEACRSAGLPVEEVGSEETDLPYPVTAAIRLADQAQIHPMRVLDRLTAQVREAGGIVVEGVRVRGLRTDDGCRLRTDAGEVRAETVVLATGMPILDRGMYFAQIEPERSYALAYRVPGPIPRGMYLSVDRHTRSLRTAPVDGEELLLVGGNGHPVGRARSPRALEVALDSWARDTFPGAEQTHRWSAQDYQFADRLPYVGPIPGTHDRVMTATGFNKWGMANAVAAALALSGRITGEQPSWAGPLAEHGIGAHRALETARLNAVVGAYMSSRWIGAELTSLPEEPPAEGQGTVGREGLRPTAVSTVEGQTRKVSAVCTHLGGVLRWNDAECTWDCPLHGSRFAPDGTRLEGPATRDLGRR